MNTISLDGAWQVAWNDHHRGLRGSEAWQKEVDPSRTIPAVVPGEIHLDLMRAGLLADVDRDLNVLAARWVEEVLWTWRRSIEIPVAATVGRAWLVFDGLDHHAVIALNGSEVGRHQGSFHPGRVEVTGKLVAGTNTVAVTLDGGLYATGDKPGANFSQPDAELHKRHWLRKPQSQFGWDWSPRLINVGIHRSCRVEWTEAAVRPDQLAVTSFLSDDLASGSVRVRWHVVGLSASTPVTLDASVAGSTVTVTAEAVVAQGDGVVECRVAVPQPRLWWPVGHGAQDRYPVTARLTVAGAVIAERTVMVGFRHIRFDQSVHPEGGRFCILEINRRRIFCKGGNLVPADLIPARVDRARYATLVDRALESHFNLLRIWGGGHYETEDFYDLCDERGILVWQEFIFACSRYPGDDDEFYRTVRHEATYQLRRLAHRPSLVIWCGNNEIEMGFWSWGYAEKRVMPDHQIYHHLLPRLFAAEDGSRHWQPSSPWSPDGEHPNADQLGDQHPWTVGFHNGDFRDYRRMICRFPNEGGILGPTSLPTVLACLPEGQRHVGSFAFQQHDNDVNSWTPAGVADRMITTWTGRDPKILSISEYVYWGGLVQGEGLSTYVRTFRRRMFDSAAAIFWMFNDCWPCTRSWTTVDVYLRRTPSFHPVRRAMAPLAVVVVEDGAVFRIIAVNDRPEAVTVSAEVGVCGLAGGWSHRQRLPQVVAANTRTEVATLPRAALADAQQAMVVAALYAEDGALIARDRLLLPLFTELALVPAPITVSVANGLATFCSPVYALGVCIDLDGEAPLADNFFDLWPDEPYVLPWTAPAHPVVLYCANPRA